MRRLPGTLSRSTTASTAASTAATRSRPVSPGVATLVAPSTRILTCTLLVFHENEFPLVIGGAAFVHLDAGIGRERVDSNDGADLFAATLALTFEDRSPGRSRLRAPGP